MIDESGGRALFIGDATSQRLCRSDVWKGFAFPLACLLFRGCAAAWQFAECFIECFSGPAMHDRAEKFTGCAKKS